MTTKLKYNLEGLEWDEEHKRNKEGVYCYCGLDYNEGDPMLVCEGCNQLFHWDCVSCLKIKPLYGDSFYRFRCSVCNNGTEEYERELLSWVQVIYLVLYHLITTYPDKKYFRWRENVCATINEYWDTLMPGKAKTVTWHNTVAGCLSTHNVLFKSGFDDTQQPGNWTLQSKIEPAKTKFKAPTKQKDTQKPVKRERNNGSESKRQRKKHTSKKQGVYAGGADDILGGSEAEKEILEVLNETTAGSKRSIRHRVSFSDDESDIENGQRDGSRRSNGKRRKYKPLEDDDDLLQSLALYTKLEKERLGSFDSPNGNDVIEAKPDISENATNNIDGDNNGDLGSLSDCSSLSSWSTDPEIDELLTHPEEPNSQIQQLDEQSNEATDPQQAQSTLNPTAPLHAAGPSNDRTNEAVPKQLKLKFSFKKTDAIVDGGTQPVSEDIAFREFSVNIKRDLRETAPENDDDDENDEGEDEDDEDVNGNAMRDSGHSDENECSGSEHTNGTESRRSNDRDTQDTSTDDGDKHTAAVDPDSDLKEIGWTHIDSSIQPQELFPEAASSEGKGSGLKIMNERSEWELAAKLTASQKELTTSARRLRRRLHLRRFKRMLGLPIFDIDQRMRTLSQHDQTLWVVRELDRKIAIAVYGRAAEENNDSSNSSSSGEPGDRGSGCRLDSARKSGGDSAPGALGAGDAHDAANGGTPGGLRAIRMTPYANSFASRLMGRAVMQENLTSAVAKVSPYHGRLLRPFIWRDVKCLPEPADEPDGALGGSGRDRRNKYSQRSMAMLQTLRAIRSRSHPLYAKLGMQRDRGRLGYESIDYVFFQKEHLQQVNELLCNTFWPGIDMTEALLYPEFSIVALYKRRVVGCAFLTPDAYLTYISVAGGWEGAGIATFMVYHLTQTVPTKDVTLHVSATNLAMLLYQRFGFKPEKFAVDFYRHYLPESSRICRSAYFMRLRRY